MWSCKSIADMPDEILLKIFSHLSVKELSLSIQYVNHHWWEVSQDSELWNKLGYYPDNHTSETEITEILRRSPKLQAFIPNKFMKRKMLQTVIDFCKDIRKLELYMDELNYNIVSKLITECKNIEFLSIVEIGCDEKQCFQLISKCPHLKTLVLCGNVPSNKHCIFKPIADGCPALQHLDLRNLYDYSNEDLQYLISKKKEQLRSLFLKWKSEDHKSTVPLLEPCKTLETLHVEEHSDVMSKEGFQALTTLPKLKRLYLPHFRCARIEHMLNFFKNGMVSNLQELDISIFENFEDRLAQTIFQKCTKLKRLDLVYCPKLTDEGLETIPNLCDLEHLNLCSCPLVTDSGMQYITKCLNLKYLNLNGCSVTVKSMSEIFNLKKLQSLQLLGDFNASEYFLHCIPSELKYLVLLKVGSNEPYEHIVADLKRKMPKLHVEVILPSYD